MSPSLDDRLELVSRLRHLPGLDDAKPELLEALGTVTDVVTLRPRETLATPGEHGRDLLLVLRGHVRVRGDKTAWTLGPHDELGWLEFLADRPATYTATVEEPGLALRVSADGARGLLEDPDCALLQRWMRHVAEMAARCPDRNALSRHLGRLRTDGEGLTHLNSNDDFVSAMLRLRRLSIFARADVEAISRLARELCPVRYDGAQPPWSAGIGPDGLVLLHDEEDEACVLLGLVELLTDDARAPEPLPGPATGVLIRRQLLVDVLEDHRTVGISIARELAEFLLQQ